MYYIESLTPYNNWEVLPEGNFETLEGALKGMEELENNLGWRDLRIKCPDGELIYGEESEESEE